LAFIIESTTDCIESVAGLALAGEISRSCGLSRVSKNMGSFGNAILGMYGLLLQGRSTFEEIALFRKSTLFKTALGLSFVPAKETLRLYLEKIASVQKNIDSIRACNIELLKKVPLTTTTVGQREYMPIDIDVSVMDNSGSQKEGVSRTYMGVDGYAPIFSYIGTEGYLLDCELRPGSQHCQKGTPAFLERTISYLEKLSVPQQFLFRMDSGNDAYETIKPIMGNDRFFIIKRNLRKERRDEWLELAQTFGQKREIRPGKSVYIGTITKAHPKADPDMPEFDIVFEVTERTIDRNDNTLLIPEIEVETWWTNMYESPDAVIALYHDHATSEQFHSELKNDMDVERLPSGKLIVNSLVLNIAMLAFNTLRLIGQTALGKAALLPYKTETMRKRLKKVISDLILVSCKLVWHSRQWTIKIFHENPWLPIFKELYPVFQEQ